MAHIEKPKSMAELDALYADLKAQLANGTSDGVVEQQHGDRFEDEIQTSTTLVIPIWYNGEELGAFSLSGDRILGTRTTGKARYDEVRRRYAHVLAPKSKQTFEECRRGNRDADKALSELVDVLEGMIRYARYRVEFERLPRGDDTWAESTLSTVFSAVGMFSKATEAKLRKGYGIQVRPKDAVFTARELCRVLSEVMRNELVFRLPTMADEIEWLESPEYRMATTQTAPQRTPPYTTQHYVAHIGKEKVGQYNPLLLVPAVG